MLLQHFTATHAAFLHARGEQGTEHLLRQLPLRGAETVLEIGCGTGATLVRLKSRFPHLQLTGLDADPAMLQTSRHRLAFCGLGQQVQLLAAEAESQIPDGSVDTVYLESVLAILDDAALAATLRLIGRVLRPGGILAFNESIWLETVEPAEIEAINRHCRAAFGIAQCRPGWRGAEAVAEEVAPFGLRLRGIVDLETAQALPLRRTWADYRSRLFTVLGRARRLLRPELRRQYRAYEAAMGTIFEPGRRYLSGWVWVFGKEEVGLIRS